MKSRLENGYPPPHLSPGTLTCSSIYLFFFFFFLEEVVLLVEKIIF